MMDTRTSPELHVRALALDQLLRHHQGLFRPNPFTQLRLPWEAALPELSRALRGLDEGQLQAWEDDPGADPSSPRLLQSWRARCIEACALRPLSASPARPVPLGMSDRKRAQVVAFAQVAEGWAPRPLVDWCAGKGHLGRYLGAARCVEREAELAGPLHLLGDALSPEAPSWLFPGGSAVALHACGELSDALLRAALTRGLRGLVLAPCCPHRRRRPLRPHPRLLLRPNDDELRLATLDELVASPRRRDLHLREKAHRLGLDLLLREASGLDRYTPLPSADRSLIDLPFRDFCEAMAARFGLRLPLRWSAEAAEAAGRERLRQVRGLAMVRRIFRRPLETWTVIERGLWLAEAGWEVELGLFCSREATPRNIALRARRPDQSEPSTLLRGLEMRTRVPT
jgi:hypothetical protein